jgi:hypothetical protein
MHTNQEGGRGVKHVQDNTNNNQKLAVASMLAAIVDLLPTDQFGIILLIFSKCCSLFLVEETTSHLDHPMFGLQYTSAYTYT